MKFWIKRGKNQAFLVGLERMGKGVRGRLALEWDQPGSRRGSGGRVPGMRPGGPQ